MKRIISSFTLAGLFVAEIVTGQSLAQEIQATDEIALEDRMSLLNYPGSPISEGSMDATVGGRFGIDTFGIGEDSGQPVAHKYQAPFKFTGQIEQVVVEVR
jgi:hypothetical protein